MATAIAAPRTIPGPKQKYPGQQIMAYRRDPVGYLSSLVAEYGEVVGLKFGPIDVVLLNNPDYIKEVLVTHSRLFHKGIALKRAKRMLGEGLLTSEDDFHLRQRRLVQPAFHRQRINAYAGVMAEYAGQACERWQDGQVADISQEMARLTLAIVGKTLFDADVEGEAEEIGRALTSAMELFPLITLPFSEILEKLPIPAMQRFKKGKARLDETIYRIIEERRASGEDRGDLLSMLIMATDTEGDGTGMTNRQLRDESMTLFLAGHETTANALTWTFYLLSQNPEAEARLHEEVDRVLGDRLPGVEDLKNLPYTEKVLSESMRLYPSAWGLGRTALQDVPVGEYVIPAKSLVLMTQWVMHRDPRYYPDPERFDPERWNPGVRELRPKFSYFPFGGGPRLCIGEPFAWMEGQLLLATIARRWRMRLLPGHPVATQPLITLRPKYGMKMILERRK